MDLTALASCTRLEALSLRGCDRIVSIEALECCFSLLSLDMTGCDQLIDLSPLEAATALQELALSRCEKIESIAPLRGCVGLLKLDLSHCDGVVDIKALGHCTCLEVLDLSNCTRLSDVAALGKLSLLQVLKLNGCMGLRDVSSLGGHALHTVQMAGTQPLYGIQPQHAAAFGLRRKEAERKAREETARRRAAQAAEEAMTRRVREARDAAVVETVECERAKSKAALAEEQDRSWDRERGMGRWALHEACRKGDLETVQGLLRVDERPFGETRGDQEEEEDAARLLHHLNDNLNESSAAFGEDKAALLTPLQWAADSGSELLCACLLAARASPDGIGGHVDGFSPLHMASLHGHTTVAQVLLEGRASVDPLSVSRDPRAPATGPLHLACEQGHAEVAGVLLRHGADVMLLDGDGDTPLHLAACGTNGKGHSELVELLLRAGADPGAKRRKGGAVAAKLTRDKGLRELLLAAAATTLQPPTVSGP